MLSTGPGMARHVDAARLPWAAPHTRDGRRQNPSACSVPRGPPPDSHSARGSRRGPSISRGPFLWRWRESNPRPPAWNQDFSGRSPLRPFSAPAISRTSRRAGLSHCSCRVEPRDRALGQWPSSRRQRPGRGPARADGRSHSLRRRGRRRCAMYWHLLVCDDG